jgi:flagella basal body P-ring formation protein FlgA
MNLCRALLAGVVLGSATPGGQADGSAGSPEGPLRLTLNAEAQTGVEGIYLNQIVSVPAGVSLPALKIGDAPPLGQVVWLTPTEIAARAGQTALGPLPPTWAGAARVQVGRRARQLDEPALIELLTETLQPEVANQGELELRPASPWKPVTVPDDPLTLKLVDFPANGLWPTFVVRFELAVGAERLGAWQTVVKARLFREVLVAQASLRRGQALSPGDFKRERRDVLQHRDALAELPLDWTGQELAQSLSAGTVLSGRALRLRPVIHRGEVVEAVLIDGSLHISLKVEAMEDGAPGQIVRARNLTTRKELRGKVRDEQTIVVWL